MTDITNNSAVSEEAEQISAKSSHEKRRRRSSGSPYANAVKTSRKKPIIPPAVSNIFKKKKKSSDVDAGVTEEQVTTELFDSDFEKAAVYCDNVVKIYKSEEVEVIALQGLDLRIDLGEMVAIIGNSGSGKSTLMNLIGGLDKQTAGMVYVLGNNMAKMTENQIVHYKQKDVGFVWQNNARNLIPYLSAVENVEIPMIISNKADRHKRAKMLLDMVGLSHRYASKLNQMSGGEQQRVAIAIALANEPKILLADEPTGAVDNKTADLIFSLFRKINQELGVTIIIVTHDRTIARKVDRVVNIRDGRISSELLRHDAYLEELKRIEENRTVSLEETHTEYAAVDRIGRMQIPADVMEKIGLNGKGNVTLSVENGKLVVTVPDSEKSRLSKNS